MSDKRRQEREKPSFEPSGSLAQDSRKRMSDYAGGDSSDRKKHRREEEQERPEKRRHEERETRHHEEREVRRHGGRRSEERERPRHDEKGKRRYEERETRRYEQEKPSFEPSGKLSQVKKEMPDSIGGRGNNDGAKEQEKEKPSFEPSGKLAQDTNTFKGVLIKYNEPPEAKVPKLRWRMYPFKGQEELPVIYIHRQSAYLVGRDRKIADFPIDHPSCSKQHAVLQYRSLPYERMDGSRGRRTRPYVIDLGSGNGTYLNGQRIEAQRYYELKEKDVLKFGFSSREYVMLHEQSLQREEDEEDTGSEGEEDEMDQVIDASGVEEKLAEAEDDDLF